MQLKVFDSRTTFSTCPTSNSEGAEVKHSISLNSFLMNKSQSITHTEEKKKKSTELSLRVLSDKPAIVQGSLFSFSY